MTTRAHARARRALLGALTAWAVASCGSTASRSAPVAPVQVPSTTAPTTSSSTVDPTTTSNAPARATIEWHSPGDAFIIHALPVGVVASGPPRVETSPTGTATVSQTFLRTDPPARLIVTLETGPGVPAQLSRAGMTPHADVVTGHDVFVWTDPNTGQRAVAWAPTERQVLWIYGNKLDDDEIFAVARSITVAA